MTITPEEFYKQMKELHEKFGEDEEVAHSMMDDMICKVLMELGYQEGVDVFRNQAKWYA